MGKAEAEKRVFHAQGRAPSFRARDCIHPRCVSGWRPSLSWACWALRDTRLWEETAPSPPNTWACAVGCPAETVPYADTHPEKGTHQHAERHAQLCRKMHTQHFGCTYAHVLPCTRTASPQCLRCSAPELRAAEPCHAHLGLGDCKG